jgi:hypothetical protein
VGAKHRMTDLPEQMRPPTARRVRRRLSGVATVCDILSASMLCAASLTALLTNAVVPGKPMVEATIEPAPTSQPVRQEGTVIAVSADSVTARSANGYTQTYLVTPNTILITNGGSQPATAAPDFAINDRVDIVGTIRDGTALATAVADRDMGHGNRSPMDYVAGQPVSAVPGRA